jgi:predicted transcriptional regulator
MMTDITLLDPEDSLEAVVDVILSGTERDFIVTDNNDNVVGIVYNQDLIRAMRGEHKQLLVNDIMRHDFDKVSASDDLSDVFRSGQSEKKSFFPVIENGRLIGAIDITNINEFMIFRSDVHY